MSKSIKNNEPVLEGYYIVCNKYCDFALVLAKLKEVKQSFIIDLGKAQEIYPYIKGSINPPYPYLEVSDRSNILFKFTNTNLVDIIRDNCSKTKEFQQAVAQTAQYIQELVENREYFLPEELFKYLRGFTAEYICAGIFLFNIRKLCIKIS